MSFPVQKKTEDESLKNKNEIFFFRLKKDLRFFKLEKN